MKKGLLFLVLLPCLIPAAPSSYNILRCPPGFTPTIDDDLAEWDGSFFVDSLRSDSNIRFRTDTLPWTNVDFQYHACAAYDDDNVYFAIRAIRDDALQTGGSNPWCDDAFKINPGGKATAFYVRFGGGIAVNPSCPFSLGSTLFVGVQPSVNGGMPAFECSISRQVLDPFGMKTFQMQAGFQDIDSASCMDFMEGSIGMEYLGNKTDDCSCAWDNPMFYPTFNLADPANDENRRVGAKSMLHTFPNPFYSTAFIDYHAAGVVEIFSLTGIKVYSKKVPGQGRLFWDPSGLSCGVYFCRLTAANITFSQRLIYAK